MTAVTLEEWQREIDANKDFRSRVAEAKDSYERHNRTGVAAFDELKKHLDGMCHHARRCMYCEDSAAYQIEHFRPKSLYPDQTFVWENLLYSCGACNHPKNARFKIVSQSSGRKLDVAPRNQRKGRSGPPPAGNPLLIDPSIEDPLDFLELVMTPDTFTYRALGAVGTLAYERAIYTRDLLKLDARDYLPKSRECAYYTFLAHVEAYAKHRQHGASQTELSDRIERMLKCPHIGVWRQMQRHYQTYPELVALFALEPSALKW